MDTDLKCNRLTCRRPLTDKAVVVSSHIFCVECANELFNASRLCPACETTLSEPDDVVVSSQCLPLVVCSLHPSNDYKTSVLSGLTPSVILEICSRAISFWQYQIHQENSFQHAVVRNVNDKNAQLQKQLENVVREANGEISLLSNKNAGKLSGISNLNAGKCADMQDAARERDKEYPEAQGWGNIHFRRGAKKGSVGVLQSQHDKIKRKALLAPNAPGRGGRQPLERRPAQQQAQSICQPGRLGCRRGRHGGERGD
ncbi:hypothetical protein C8J57DRAFT_1053224 [Mycena rebaudengoi]|nr:hypothetical protein C8J57DRAFT_1053224 [Mycena rebaudengoi]